MKRHYLTIPLLVCFIIGVSAAERTEEKPEVLHRSPDGNLRVERNSEDVWVVSTKDAAQRVKLPVESPESIPDEFHVSPNDDWIFTLRHGGSCLRDGDLFHRVSPAKIDMFDSFNQMAWKNCVKLGALKRDFSAEGFCAMTFFLGWSIDSSRLLVRVSGGEEKREMRDGYIYFNTRTSKFETTDYLRKLNKAKSEPLGCPESVDPLPPLAALKERYEKLDRQLNETFARLAKKPDSLHDEQRGWIRHRDEGLNLYLASVPATEKDQRRFQFLGDVTAARLDYFELVAENEAH